MHVVSKHYRIYVYCIFLNTTGLLFNIIYISYIQVTFYIVCKFLSCMQTIVVHSSLVLTDPDGAYQIRDYKDNGNALLKESINAHALYSTN